MVVGVAGQVDVIRQFHLPNNSEDGVRNHLGLGANLTKYEKREDTEGRTHSLPEILC